MTPQFASLADFIAMGGHGPFVWGAWGLTAVVIVALVVRAMSEQRRWKARLAELESMVGERQA
jgi:heme exporter protein D